MITAVKVACQPGPASNRTSPRSAIPLQASKVLHLSAPTTGLLLCWDKKSFPLLGVRYLSSPAYPFFHDALDSRTPHGFASANALQIQVGGDCLRLLEINAPSDYNDYKGLDAPFRFLALFRILLEQKTGWQTSFIDKLRLFFNEAHPSPKRPKWMTDAVERVEKLWDEPLSLNALAKAANVNPVTVSKGFPKYEGCTMRHYVRQLRVKNAIVLLRTTTKSLTAIAYDCGFSDQSHFCRSFRQMTGFRPKEFQNL